VPEIPAILADHVTLEVECVDRLYLNAYVPSLQYSGGVNTLLREARGMPIASAALLGKMTDAFMRSVHGYAKAHGVPLQPFPRGVRKEAFVRPYFEKAIAERRTGVVFIGTAQEKARAWHGVLTEQGKTAHQPWFTFQQREVYVKWVYMYYLDAEFGPTFFKVCTYAPFTARVYLNGHEWAKRQLEKAGIAYQSLDNGFLSCEDPAALQAICNRFGYEQIWSLFHRLTKELPLPLTSDDRKAGFDYRLSILQAEVSLTQVFDQPRYGRAFFEQAIRDHLDLGRPDQVALLFDRRVQRNTPGSFSTRVITDGVHPSIHATYKHSGVKQYFKEGRALRTETTINDTYDIGLPRSVEHLAQIVAFGAEVNRRLLRSEEASAASVAGVKAADRVLVPLEVNGQRVSALRFGDPHAMALEAALCTFAVSVMPTKGFRAADLRAVMSGLLSAESYSAGQATYDLRRLRLRGFIERIEGTHRYRLTPWGLRTAFALVKLQTRIAYPALALDHLTVALNPAAQRALRQLDSIYEGLVAAAAHAA